MVVLLKILLALYSLLGELVDESNKERETFNKMDDFVIFLIREEHQKTFKC